MHEKQLTELTEDETAQVIGGFNQTLLIMMVESRESNAGSTATAHDLSRSDYLAYN
jgi:bacteriocin-like protein